MFLLPDDPEFLLSFPFCLDNFFSHSFRVGLPAMYFPSFLSLEIILSFLHSWKIVHWILLLRLRDFSFQNLKNVVPFPHDISDFWCELQSFELSLLLQVKVSSRPSPTVFWGLVFIFVLSLVLRSLTMMCLSKNFFEFIVFGIYSASQIWKFMSLGRFQPWFPRGHF